MAARISVIVPCFNEIRYICRCLQSLLEQSLAPHEIIVVDDGSNDGTVEAVEAFNVRLLRQNHAGPGAARNLAAGQATGDILVFADADMFFDRDYVRHLTAPIIAGKAKGTFTKEEFVGNPDNVWAVCWNLETLGNPDRRVPAGTPEESPVFRAIRRDAFMAVHGYDTSLGYGEDMSLAPKLGFTAQAASAAVCYHNNPSTLDEVFHSAKWMGKGERFGTRPWKLWKFTLPVSLILAVQRAVMFKEWHFLIFKPVYDAGILSGMLARLFFRTHVK
jgi:glycosyltransferase involved in cell wall biosynthesis